MAEFNVRSDSVNVEQIMEQIRSRIREKRGTDYTEEQIRALASVKLEKFLDPRGVRSDLLEQYRRAQNVETPAFTPRKYVFEEETLYETHRAPLQWIRRRLQPLLKLFFNPNPLIQALNIQSELNRLYVEREALHEIERRNREQLNYEVIHNLVVEMTRVGIEVKNLKMRIESLTGRLEFNERRARALESVVVYKPSSEAPEDEAAGGTPAERPAERTSAGPPSIPEGPGQRSRRRRRRRGRRGGAPPATIIMGASPGAAAPAAVAATEPAVGRDSASHPVGAPPLKEPDERPSESGPPGPNAGPTGEQ
jgi:hypothetical protein